MLVRLSLRLATPVTSVTSVTSVGIVLDGRARDICYIAYFVINLNIHSLYEGSKAKRKKVAQQLDLLPKTSEKLFECH